MKKKKTMILVITIALTLVLIGGSWEFTMSVMTNTNNEPFSGRDSSSNSGFNGPYSRGGSLENSLSLPEEKYYNIYSNGSYAHEFMRGYIGDATREMGPFMIKNSYQVNSWYEEITYMMHPANPWVSRGGHFNNYSSAGLSASYYLTGAPDNGVTFRIVLTPELR